MKILHLASFDGNVGDHANHSGFRSSMDQYIDETKEYTNMEIREFYKSWNLRRFDMELVDYINTFDLLVIGGGNFFEMCWDYSSTGTTIDLSKELLTSIQCPILFNGLGIDDKNGTVSEQNIKKFGKFLSTITSSNQYLVSVRNDGSKEIAAKYFPPSIMDRIIKVPDGGFFVNPKEYEHVEIPHGYNIIAINLAGDSPNIRFSSDGMDGRITEKEFISQFAKYLMHILEYDDNLFVVFVPHIIKDYELITKVINNVIDCLVRTRISIAPCVNGSITDGDYIMDIYRKSTLSLGMRYHANVCSLAVDTPFIGIVNFYKHKRLFYDIGLSDRMVESDLPDFSNRLYDKTIEFFDMKDSKKEENQNIKFKLIKENEKYFTLIKQFLLDNNLLDDSKESQKGGLYA